MKTLQQYIMEKRGVVTGENDWSATVLDIIDLIKKSSGNTIEAPVESLPRWLDSLTIILRPSSLNYQGEACYVPSDSTIWGDGLQACVQVNIKDRKDADSLKYTLNHEIQHAFDDWIIRTKRKLGTLEDFITIPTGYSELRMDEDPLQSIVNLAKNPEKSDFNDIFIMFDQCTYWFSNTETNAYLREWALYVPDYIKDNGTKFDWYKECTTKQLAGQSPIMIIDCLYDIRDNWSKIQMDEDDWQYVMGALNPRWTKRFIGKAIDGAGKEGVYNILDAIIKKFTPNIINKYMRVIKDNGLEIINGPKCFK